MALTKQQIDIVIKTLSEMYGKDNVNYKSPKITIMVDVPKNKEDRLYRKSILVDIQKSFSVMGAVYTPPTKGSTGAVKLSGTEIHVKKKLASGGDVKKAGLKPSDVVPSIVNDWLSPDEIVKNVETYIKKQDFDSETEKQILNLLQATLKGTGTTAPFNAQKTLVSAEFFEILTSVKLGVLMRANDKKIRTTLGIPKDMDLSKSKIKIYIPKQANYPLVDYFISVSSSDKKTEEDSIKISVKSKVAGDKVNTVKFNSIFGKEKDVDNWYNQLDSTLKRKQIGQKTIAESAMSGYGNFRGKNMAAVPLISVAELLNNDRSNIIQLINSKFKNIDIKVLEKCINLSIKKLKSVSYKEDIYNFIGDDGFKENDYLQISMMLSSNIVMRGGKTPDLTLWNVAHMCEKILEESSKQNSKTNYNFYQIFFDEVLKKRRIAYAVTTRSGNQINYNFYSLVNYAKEYHDWINLRTKNSANQPNDVIGLEA